MEAVMMMMIMDFYINWMVNNLGAKPLTSSLLKVKVKAATEQQELQQHPLLSGLGEVPQVLTLSSPTAEPSYSTEFKNLNCTYSNSRKLPGR